MLPIRLGQAQPITKQTGNLTSGKTCDLPKKHAVDNQYDRPKQTSSDIRDYQSASSKAGKTKSANTSTGNGSIVKGTSSEPVQMCLATAAESGVEDQPVPDTITLVKSFGFLKSYLSRPHSLVVARCTVEMSNRQRSIDAEEKQAVFNILKSFNSLGTFSAEMDKKLNIRSVLLNILGETSHAVCPYEYPEPLQRNASIILNRLDIELGAEEALEQSKPSPELGALTATKRRRKTTIQTPSSELSRLAVEDPTFKHIMRGIQIGGDARSTYKLDTKYLTPPRNFRIFGHNGLEVGDWWPLQLCALRDGAHGSAQGGIAGSAITGAYSIIVSSTSSVQLYLRHAITFMVTIFNLLRSSLLRFPTNSSQLQRQLCRARPRPR